MFKQLSTLSAVLKLASLQVETVLMDVNIHGLMTSVLFGAIL